jgi:multiple sugar transport system substrate-binding protein
MYRKNSKKSISSPNRIDLFLLLAVLVLIISPIIINFVFRLNAEIGRTELVLSPRCEELFGRDTAEALLRGFGERNPDLRIRFADITEEKSREPDILFFDEGDFSGLVTNGALMSLNPYIHTESGEEQLVIPLVSFMDLLFYNIELLKAAGFNRPPKTREEFFTYAKTVSGGNNEALAGAAGAAMGLRINDKQAISRDVFSWIWAAGNDFWPNTEPASARPVFNNKAIVSDISFLGRLNREKALAPWSFDVTGAQRLEEFSQGKIAMMIASTRDIPMLREKMGDDAFGITAVPGAGLTRKYSIGLSSYYAAISSACAYPDEAWSFLVFLTEQSPLLCAELKAVPGVVSGFITGNYIKDDPFYSKAWDIFESSEIVYGFSGKTKGDDFERIVREELLIFFDDNRTAEETVTVIQQRWDTF